MLSPTAGDALVVWRAWPSLATTLARCQPEPDRCQVEADALGAVPTVVVGPKARPTVPYPLSTGQAAQVLGVTEPRLNLLVRKHRLRSIPLVSAGRRLWHESHLVDAASALGLGGPEIGARIRAQRASSTDVLSVGQEVRHV